MRKVIAAFAAFTLALMGMLVLAGTASASSKDGDRKVTICHATGSGEYQSITVDQSALNGHYGQHHQDGQDIIPPTTKKPAGQNWTEEGRAIHANKCVVPEPEGPGEPETPEQQFPAYSHELTCGSITMTFTNPTNFAFAFDYRVDDADPTNDYGTGPVYTIVNVASGGTQTRTVAFPEDSGTHTVAYRLNLGAEQDWYLPWVTVTVESDCEENPVQVHPVSPTVTQPTCTSKGSFVVSEFPQGITYAVEGNIITATVLDGYVVEVEPSGWQEQGDGTFTFEVTYRQPTDCGGTPPVDVCSNIDGVQTTAPEGLVEHEGECHPPVTEEEGDVCVNLPGNQPTVPEGMKMEQGSCVEDIGGGNHNKTPPTEVEAEQQAKPPALKPTLPYTGSATGLIGLIGALTAAGGGAVLFLTRRFGVQQ